MATWKYFMLYDLYVLDSDHLGRIIKIIWYDCHLYMINLVPFVYENVQLEPLWETRLLYLGVKNASRHGLPDSYPYMAAFEFWWLHKI